MKNKIVLLILLIATSYLFAQESSSDKSYYYVQANYFYGNIIKHSPKVTHLVASHPEGFNISFNKKNYGLENWEHRFRYPDFGVSFTYLNYKNSTLGQLYATYGHYNFYLLNRTNQNQLLLRAGIGLAYVTNPYEKETNNKNKAFGSYLNSSTYFKIYYQRENIIDRFGVNAGLTFIHASNSSLKAPNTGLNVWAMTLGVNYNLEDNNLPTLIPSNEEKKHKEPIKYNIAVRTGFTESEYIGSGAEPFVVLSAYADKRFSRKYALQFGTDLYLSKFMEVFYDINRTKRPVIGEERPDFKRVGLFVGHELFINKISVEGSIGYYIKYPFVYQGRVYETLGLKRYINNKWFATVRLKAHGANAETVEFGAGIRF